jgi:CRISPR-associated protein Csc3
VRGVLTNLIQKAALAACSSDDRVPLLYSPTGVVYLARRNTFNFPETAQIADRVVERVKQLSKRTLAATLTGFGRDGKGMKHAAYYRLFFNQLEMLGIGLQATLKIVHASKAPSAAWCRP